VLRDADLRRRANDVLIAAHHKAVEAIRTAGASVPIGLTLSMFDYQVVAGGDASAIGIGATWMTSFWRRPATTTSSGCSATRGCASAPRACSIPIRRCA
jgi:hypothetical protein